MARQPHILICGVNYEPEQTGIGPYTSGMVHHLAEQGYKMTAITGMPHYPQWRIDAAFRGKIRAREHQNHIDVRRMWHYTPTEQSAVGRGLYELTFYLQAMAIRDVERPACVIGVVPSLSGGAAAARLAGRYDAPLGLIFQDLMGQAAAQSGIPGGGKVAALTRAIERHTARMADRVAVVAEAFRPQLVALGVAPDRITHLPNWSHVRSPIRARDEVRRSLSWGLDTPIVLHAGNMGYKQDLENILRTARLAAVGAPGMTFVLMGDGSDRHRLESLARGLDNVVFLDPEPEETFMDVLAAADVLVLNERSTVLTMSLPSKITSYFRADRPVVAAVPAGGTTSKELHESGGAIVVDAGDPEALLRAVERVVKDQKLATDLVTRAKRYADAKLDKTQLLRRVDDFVRLLIEGDGVRDPAAAVSDKTS